MEIKNSKTVDVIYETAQKVKDKYNSAVITNAHIIAATISLYLQFDDAQVNVAELTEAINEISSHFPSLNDFYNLLIEHIKMDLFDSYEESVSFENACELAKVFTLRQGESYVTTAVIVKQMLAEPTGLLATIKNNFFTKNNDCNKTIKKDDNELFEDKNPTDILTLIQKAKLLQANLLDKVYGQDEAVSALVSGYFNCMVAGQNRTDSKPVGTFLFAGAPGVGKTYLAECTAKALSLPYRRFDMSSFSDKESVAAFSGTNKVYKNADTGLVTRFVAQNPNCIILFDEIEKAHINVIHLFLQILDAGYLQDAFTEENVSFSNAIIIMTTNAGRSLYENADYSQGKNTISRKVILNALENEISQFTNTPLFPKAICSRFASGSIILFNPLGTVDLINITNSYLNEYCRSFKKNQKINIEIDELISPVIIFSEGGKADARTLKGKADNFIKSEVYSWLKFAHEKDSNIVSNLKKLEVKVSFGDNIKEIKNLFSSEEIPNILLFSERQSIISEFPLSPKYNLITATEPNKAKEIVAELDISFVICDIIKDNNEAYLNIEDTSSNGRKLFEVFNREDIPIYVLCESKQQINAEERQSLLEQNVHGIIECNKKIKIVTDIERISSQEHCENMLKQLARANKVLTYDCKYNFESSKKNTGSIILDNLRISPAIYAEDRDVIAPQDVSSITFDQIIGAEEAKSELQSFIDYFMNTKKYAKYAICAPKGAILYGPPGTGKTMLAKALANESHASFIATQGNFFLNSYMGDGAKAIHNIFNTARKYAPCVLFIDEIDVIAYDRAQGKSAANDTLNALLNEMDGFSTNPTKPVFVLAATNFNVAFGENSQLDSALLRRFDRRIFVDLPDKNDRKEYLLMRLNKSKQLLSNEAIESIAVRSVGMSLSDMSNIVDFALRNMIRCKDEVLTEEVFNDAYETYRYGDKNQWDEKTLHRFAIHEAGHTFVSCYFGIKPSYVSISSRSNFGGYTQYEPQSTPFLTLQDMKTQICIALAGRAAEIIFYGEKDGLSTGAADDLNQATKTALDMVSKFGMSNEYGLVVDNRSNPSENAVTLCKQVLDEQFAIALDLIKENTQRIRDLYSELIDKNHLSQNAISEILKEQWRHI